MTITMERPAVEAAPPISGHKTRTIAVALSVADAFVGSVDYSRLPELHSFSVTKWARRSTAEIHAQIGAGLGDVAEARGILGWRDALPGGRVTLDAFQGYWRGTAVHRFGGHVVVLWTHLHHLTEAQDERLTRDPQTAYAILAEVAGGAR